MLTSSPEFLGPVVPFVYGLGMRATCDSCRRSIRGTGHQTTTRTLCDQCFATFQGLAAGAMASDFDAGQSIATAGWFQRLRNKRTS